VKLTRHLVVYGRVQGVNFREAMRAQAQRLEVTGWVRNRSDGSVEATGTAPRPRRAHAPMD
jgi:acylphosphatase